MKTLNAALLLVLAATVGAHYVVTPDPTQPNRDYLPEMVYSAAAESFATSDGLGGRSVLQVPPEGTIRHDARLTPEPPASADPGNARGAKVYAAYCTPCHGGGGLGDGPVVARGYPAPPSLLAPNAVGMTDQQVFEIVTSGRLNMPGYAAQVDEDDRWRAIAYVRQLQGSARP